MSNKNETPALLVALLATVLLIGGGLWWFSQRLTNLGSSTSGTSSQTAPLDPASIAARFSTGSTLLVPMGPASPAQERKQAGAAAMAAQNYDQATTDFSAALQARPNDPEALIFLNNALIGRGKAHEIAIAVPLDTDVDASLEMLRGVAQAQLDFNQKGGGTTMPVRVKILNDGGTPERARQVAEAIVQDQNILGVVGHYSSDMSLAAGEVYNQGKVVAISPVSTSVKLSNFSPYVFRTVPSDFIAARALANYMLTQLQKQQAAVFFNSQSAYSQSLKSEFASALSLEGGQIVSEFDLSNPAFSAADSVKQATQQGATVLALLPNSGQLDRALQVVQVNQRRLNLLGGDDVYAPKTLAVGGAAAQNMVIAVPWHVLANLNTPFVKESQKLWRADVNWRTATAYDATMAFMTALNKQPDPTRQSVQEAISNPSFVSNTGALGAVRFLPSGDRNQGVQLVTIEPGNRSGQGYDFVPLAP